MGGRHRPRFLWGISTEGVGIYPGAHFYESGCSVIIYLITKGYGFNHEKLVSWHVPWISRHADFNSTTFITIQGDALMVTTNKISTCRRGPAALPGKGDGRARVLVLDDDPDLRELFDAMLVRIGCRAEICSSSSQAIAAYRSGGSDGADFDCALIDLNIDEQIDGITVGQVLRDIDPRVRLVLISGSVNPKQLETQKTHLFDAVLPKPFSLKELQQAILPCS
jgi:CheY-like chemotaxis protein